MADRHNIIYDLHRHDYGEFNIRLRNTLANHANRRDVCKKPVLPKQQYGKQPARWILITLLGNPGEWTTLAVRDDNVYLKGFRNRTGQWYEFGFSRLQGQKKKSGRMIRWPRRESIFLECDVDYESMVGVGGAYNLVNLDLSLGSAVDAVGRLSRHVNDTDGTGRASDGVKEDLARLIVMICEAARMAPHYLRVKNCMEDLHCRGCITREEVKYLLNWGMTSEALLRWWNKLLRGEDWREEDWPDRLTNIKIPGPGKALKIVHLLLDRPIHGPPTWHRLHHQIAAGDSRPSSDNDELGPPLPKRSRTQQQQQPPPQQQAPPNPGSGRSQSQQRESAGNNYECHPRPLVEVFAVHAHGFHLVGTITVFDGIRGQVIYDGTAANDNSAPSSAGGLLLLTGPYTAISADGSFTVEVDIPGPNNTKQGECGESSDVGEMNWDCYDEDNKYDQLISDTITTAESGSQVEVTYAVLSDAVEANVEVRLHLPGATPATRVYGRITVGSRYLIGSDDRAWSVLFDSSSDMGEPVTDDSGSTAPLPLARSVVAMPVGYPLLMNATLYDHAAAASQRESPIFQYQHIELTFCDGRTMEKRTSNGVAVEVKITSPDCHRVFSQARRITSAQHCFQSVCPRERGI